MKKILALTLSFSLLLIIIMIFHFSGQAVGMEIDSNLPVNNPQNPDQAGPPWFDDAWNYRRPVVISNSTELSNYQVLIRLDVDNFNFDLAEPQGEDIRIVASDGISLSYWIESWDVASQLAYLWVRLPALPGGKSTLYLYYNNPSAPAMSDGYEVFKAPGFFDDDWSQFTTVNAINAGPWMVLDGIPAVVSGTLRLDNSTGIKTLDGFQYQAVGYRANYNTGNGLEWGGFIDGASGPRTVIRDLYNDIHNLYLQDYVTDYDPQRLEPVGVDDWHDAFHIYGVRWQDGLSLGDVDHGTSSASSSLPSEVPTATLPVSFYSFSGSNATLWVDWVYVRQYHDPEPTTSVGAEQGLVDLKVVQADAPDPLYPGERLTYHLTASNTSMIDAAQVTLTDTLPGGVVLSSFEASQGSCNAGSVVVCNLGTINANSAVEITVVVTTTLDGTYTNTTVIGSPGYDPDLSNNTSEETTTVLPLADLLVTMVDHPDPVSTAVTLTYTTTITNLGPSLAEGVIATDTLPVEMILRSIAPEQGSCVKGNPVICDLGSIGAGKQINLVMEVLPGSAGVFTNTVRVASSAFDPDESNNEASALSRVDSTPPAMSWISPVMDERLYITHGGNIPLEVDASDSDDQVERVEFKLWDHLWYPNGRWVDIATLSSYPYQAELDSNLLVAGSVYQMWAFAYDQAGNDSGKRIYLERLYPFYLPLMSK